MFPEHSEIRLAVSNRKMAGKFLNIWKLNTLPKNTQIKENILKWILLD